jgi:phospholipid/cholesterol/gamma-HCH transport system permease protein
MFRNLGEMLLLFGATVRALPSAWRERHKIAEQLFDIGNASLFMACLLSFFIGGVLSLQSGPVLVENGIGTALGQLVGIAICKELAPVMMSILVAGRVGSAMAAELGSMRVYQEIDALRTLAIDPVRYLVFPRVVAVSIAVPCLVIFANLAGWLGGALVAAHNDRIDVAWSTFFTSLRDGVDAGDVLNGLVKAFCFAVCIGIICCHQGLATIGGPRGIGRSVTKAVVNSLVLILIFDYVLTRILLPFDNVLGF